MGERHGVTAVGGARLRVAIVAAITLIGLALRLRSIGNSLFGDELSTYSIVTGHGPGSIVTALDGHSVDLTPPLYFLLAWVAERFGGSPEALRAFALLAGAATIPLTYLLGIRTVGRAAAIGGALLVALSPFLIFYSTEARAYALVMFLVLAATLALLEAIAGNRGRWWAAYAAFSCAAMYTHYTAVFALAVVLVWALIAHREHVRGLLVANLAAAIGFAPWLPALAKNTGSFGTRVFGIIDPFGLHALTHDLSHWAVGHPYLQLSTEPGTAAIVLIVAGLILAAGLGALARARAGRDPGLPAAGAGPAVACGGAGPRRLVPAADTALPLLLALATPVGLALYSSLHESAWDMRNLISSWPGFALVLAAVALAPPRPVRWVTGGLVALGFAIGAAGLLSSARERPDYAAAARLVLASGGHRGPVAIIQAPTPGPYAAMDAAFAFEGDPGRPLLRVGAPSLATVLHSAPYAFLPPTSTAALVAQTESAPSDGRVFVIAPGVATAAQLLRSGAVDVPAVLGPSFGSGTSGALFGTVFTPLSAYLRELAPRYALVGSRRLPGFLALSVYVLRAR